MLNIDIVDDITPEAFLHRHLRAGRPLVVRGVTASFPSPSWSIERLRRDFPDRLVKLQVFDSDDARMADWSWGKEDLGTYLDEMNTPAGLSKYMTYATLGGIFPELMPEVRIPHFLQPYLGDAGTESYGMFVGPKGQGTEIHYHPVFWAGASQAFALSMCGQKLFRLFSPDDTDKLYPFSLTSAPTRQANWSRVGLGMTERFPAYADARPLDVYLSPGDLLYIPPHWWHCTRCIEPAISLTLFFKGHWSYRVSRQLLLRDLSVLAYRKLTKVAQRFELGTRQGARQQPR
ncbi:cupin-like domain-containing protein [Paraliomyxa miuraensis]|uniref:cupin-like domain-containing protein n=1 Tax=Paraliomyxa miuraensis TaxID=376150 RepID=UPI0022523709|nr:cupin-like domain-containing protein [Paraliomyxa miuraensis]MCX4246641.1 cupin-like domain-containing protein [Paraliomyxa miuraensis]